VRDGNYTFYSRRWTTTITSYISSWTLIRTEEYLRLYTLAQRVDSHLIQWSRSGLHELESETVWCLTPDLRWAAWKLDAILACLTTYPTRRFRYVVFDNKYVDSKGKSNVDWALEIAPHIMNKASTFPQIVEQNSLEILFLTDDKSPCIWRPSKYGQSSKLDPSKWTFLPLSTDIALYDKTLVDPERTDDSSVAEPRSDRSDDASTLAPVSDAHKQDVARTTTFAVMSVVPISEAFKALGLRGVPRDQQVEHGYNPDAATHLFDVKLEKEEHYQPIKQWFQSAWRERTGSADQAGR
jgi:hypothetical protein